MLYYASIITLNGNNTDDFYAMISHAKALGGKIALQIAKKNEDDFLIKPICVVLPNQVSIDDFAVQSKSIVEPNRWQKVTEDEYLTYDEIGWEDDSDWDLSSIISSISNYNDKTHRLKFEPEPPTVETLGLNEHTLSMLKSYGYTYVDDILHKLKQKQAGVDGRPIGEATMSIALNDDRIAYKELIQRLEQQGYL